MFKTTSTFPTSTLKCLLENTELADLLFKNFPLTDEDDLLKSDKQLLSADISSKVGWNSSAFLGPNLWDKDQLYSAAGSTPTTNSGGLHNDKGHSTTTPTTTSTSNVTVNSTNGSSSGQSSNGSNGNNGTVNGNHFKVENIDIDEFLCENNLNLNDIDSFSNHFDHVEQTRSNSPNPNVDPLLLHSPMQAAPAKSPMDDSMSHHSSNSSRKYSQDETLSKSAHSKQYKKARKSSMASNSAAANLAKQFVPDELKDEKYWARRRKNNLAAKRSRDARRMKENQIALRADFLERESEQLKKQVEDLKRENQKLKMKLIQYESSMKQ